MTGTKQKGVPADHYAGCVRIEADIGRLQTERSRQRIARNAVADGFRYFRYNEGREGRAGPSKPHGAAYGTDFLLDNDVEVAPDHFRRAQMCDNDRRADRRMARKRQFRRRREDARTKRVDRIMRFENEDRFGQIELAGDRLHPRAVEPLAIKHDGQRIAGKPRIREDVERVEAALHASNLTDSAGKEDEEERMRALEGLSTLTIVVDDLDQAVADYAVLFGVAVEDVPGDAGRDARTFRAGNIDLHLRARRTGEIAGLAALTFRVADIARATDTLARCGIPVANGMLDRDLTHGIPMALTDMLVQPAAEGGVALDHVVIRTPAPERAVALYGGRLGLDMRLDRSNPAWNARLIFFRCGDLVVEIAHVLSDGVSHKPDTFGGLSWRVPDIDATHARLSRESFDLSPVRTGRRPGSRVCTVRNRNAGVPTILLGVTPRT